MVSTALAARSEGMATTTSALLLLLIEYRQNVDAPTVESQRNALRVPDRFALVASSLVRHELQLDANAVVENGNVILKLSIRWGKKKSGKKSC